MLVQRVWLKLCQDSYNCSSSTLAVSSMCCGLCVWVVVCVFEREGDGEREMIQEKCDLGGCEGETGQR